MIWILACLAGHSLTLKTGKILHCDDFRIEDPMVIIEDAGRRYTMRSDLFDWSVPVGAWERPVMEPAQNLQATPLMVEPPGSDFLDFKIDKLDVKQTSVIDILRLLSHQANFNLIVDSAVPDSQVTFSFRDIPLRDLLDVLLGTLGLSYEYQAQHIWVRPLGALQEKRF